MQDNQSQSARKWMAESARVERRRFLQIMIALAFLALSTLACAGLSDVQGIGKENSGEILFVDDFSNPSGGWDTWIKDDTIVGYENESLRILVNQPHFDFWSRPGKRFADVHLQVDAMMADGPQNNDFGMMCRYRDRDNFYAFLIGSDGYGGILKVKDGQYSLLNGASMVYNEAIVKGSAVNHLEAYCLGHQLKFMVNGQPFLEAQDSDFLSGEIGLIAGAYDEVGVDIRFDNFVALKP